MLYYLGLVVLARVRVSLFMKISIYSFASSFVRSFTFSLLFSYLIKTFTSLNPKFQFDPHYILFFKIVAVSLNK